VGEAREYGHAGGHRTHFDNRFGAFKWIFIVDFPFLGQKITLGADKL